MPGERRQRNSSRGLLFLSLFCYSHQLTWKISNCWNLITKKNYLLFYSEYLCDYLENVKVLYQIESLVRQKTVYIYMLVFPQSFFRKETLQCVKIHNIYIIYAYVCIYIYIIVIIIIIFMCIPRKPWNISCCLVG